MLGFCLVYSSTLKIEVICSSETSVDFQRTTWRYIPEDRTLHNHRSEDLNSDNVCLYSAHLTCSFLDIFNDERNNLSAEEPLINWINEHCRAKIIESCLHEVPTFLNIWKLRLLPSRRNKILLLTRQLEIPGEIWCRAMLCYANIKALSYTQEQQGEQETANSSGFSVCLANRKYRFDSRLVDSSSPC
jgi:hypothetical protein